MFIIDVCDSLLVLLRFRFGEIVKLKLNAYYYYYYYYNKTKTEIRGALKYDLVVTTTFGTLSQ